MIDIDNDINAAGNDKRRLKKKARNIYGDQLICLSALLVMAVWRGGWRTLVLVLLSVVSGVLVDWICCRMSKKIYNPRDLSTLAAGMCIALMMPASMPYQLVICGSALAMGVKHIFGGKNNYIFNPTAVALAFLIICYPADMLLFPKLGETLPVLGEIKADLSSGIESFLMKMGTARQLSLTDILLGNFQGPIGTTHILVILVCAVCLLFRRSISAMVTLSSLGIIIIIASVFPLYDNFANTLTLELVGGYLLFGLLFLANDPQTIPETSMGKLIYGVLLGVAIAAFRYFGKVEGSFVFALLAANSFSVRMDRAGEKIADGIFSFNSYMKNRLSFYERFTQEAKKGEVKNLFDTQEIVINPLKYDMPPIDNKVLKINRKKPNLLTRTKEKIGTLGEKAVEQNVTVYDSETFKNKTKIKNIENSFKKSEKTKKNSETPEFWEKVFSPLMLFLEKRHEENTFKPIRHKYQRTQTQTGQKNNIADLLNNAVNNEPLKDEKGKNAFEEYLSNLRKTEADAKNNHTLPLNNTGEVPENKNQVNEIQDNNVQADGIIQNEAQINEDTDEYNDIDITDFEELIGMPGIMEEDVVKFDNTDNINSETPSKQVNQVEKAINFLKGKTNERR